MESNHCVPNDAARNLVFQTFVRVDPLNLVGSKGEGRNYYTRPRKRFFMMLANVIENDPSLSYRIIQEIIIRSFPIRPVADDSITNDHITEMTGLIALKLIKNGRLNEEYLQDLQSK